VDITNIGEFLRKMRKARGLTQGDVAEALGVSAQAVSKWERGENLPDVAFFPDISRILQVGAEDILHAGRIAQPAYTENDLDLFVRLSSQQKSELIQAILAREDYHLVLDDILPYSNAAHRATIIGHILHRQDYALLEQLTVYMSNDMKALALDKLLDEGRYDIIEDNMPAFTRKHRDLIVNHIGDCPPDLEIIENFIPFFDNNQRERLRDSLKIEEEGL